MGEKNGRISILSEDEGRKNPLNASGKFYVDQDLCLDHACCVDIAPGIFKMDEERWGAYVVQQPETREELAKCKEAIECCPVEAIGMRAEEGRLAHETN